MRTAFIQTEITEQNIMVIKELDCLQSVYAKQEGGEDKHTKYTKTFCCT